MTATTVIDFMPDGTVQAMHRDGFSLGFLGKQSIERASEITFNEETQLWDIYVNNGGTFVLPTGASGFAGYDIARKIEVKWLDACRLENIKPASIAGSATLLRIRDRESVTTAAAR